MRRWSRSPDIDSMPRFSAAPMISARSGLRSSSARPRDEQRAHVGRQVAQLPVALVRDQLAEADVVHLRLDLLHVDQAQRLPVGRLELALVVDLGREVLGDALAQRLVEGALEHAEISAQLLHRVEDQLPLGRAGGVLRLQVEAFRHAHRGRRGRRPDEIHGRVERGLYAWFDRIHRGRRRSTGLRQAQAAPCEDEVPSSMAPKIGPGRGTASRSGPGHRLPPVPGRVFSAAANRGSRAAAGCPRRAPRAPAARLDAGD